MLSFSKGLGRPVGAILAGDAPTMHSHIASANVSAAACVNPASSLRRRSTAPDSESRPPCTSITPTHEASRTRRGLARAVRRSSYPDSNIVMVDLPGGMEAGDVVARAKEGGSAHYRVDADSQSERSRISTSTLREAVTRAAAVVRGVFAYRGVLLNRLKVPG